MNGITVICPNSHRCVIKATPSTQLRKILEEACLKQGFDILAHQLKHQNHILDLALPLRLTGLPNNATVEMIPNNHIDSEVPMQIHIALQLADGSRFMQEFSAKTTLLDVLYKFSQKSARDLVKCADGQVPCCAYMNKEYRGKAELKSTTLEAMGITKGRCLIRYSAVSMSPDELSKLENQLAEENERKKKLEKVYEIRKTENDRRLKLEMEREEIFERELKVKHEMEEARFQERSQVINRNTVTTMPQSSERLTQNSNSDEPTTESQIRHQGSSRLEQLHSLLNRINNSIETNAADFLSEQLIGENGRIHISDLQTAAGADIDQYSSNVCNPVAKSSDTSHIFVEKCNRMPVIIRRNSESDKAGEAVGRQDNIDDQFFELTVSDVQSIRRDLIAEAGVQEQKTLIPKTYVAERNRLQKEESYKHTVVRFNCADKTTIQAQFISREPVSRLFEFIRENLKNATTNFDLCLANQKLPSTTAKNLIEVGVAPKSSLYIRFHSSENAFAAHFILEKFCEVPIAEANELSLEWLSVNSIYQPYNPKVENAKDVRPHGKRQSEAAESGAGPPKLRQQPSENLPKWFRKP
uniref:TUG ubiquitin-like domain-containing protein n=1 Tax=Setaria digitata TaxID=48799 RepID=A0A915PIT6_9BILA